MYIGSKQVEQEPVKQVGFEDGAHLKKYIMWENKSNICWLDASMAIIAHNKVIKKHSTLRPLCNISKIFSAYDNAIKIINNSENENIEQKLNLARGLLNYIQESTLEYLKPILKFKTGDPESAFCCLYNLLKQDPIIKKLFDVTWLLAKECKNCGYHSEITKNKPIVTISKIHSFEPENLTVVYCCDCNKSEQKMKLVYVSLPPCLIFNFENGAGNEKPPLNFTTQKREYHLTGIMTFEKSQDSTVNHFITWVRDPSVDKWLDCNDLNSDVIYFSPDFPDINIKDVYMYVYEAFDDFGTITVSKIAKDKKSEENIPCFYLSDSSDCEICDSQISATESNRDTRENKPLNPESSNVKLDRNTSLGKTLTTGKSAIEKTNQHAHCIEHLKNITKNMAHVSVDEGQIKPKEVDENKIPDENFKTEHLKNITKNMAHVSIDEGQIKPKEVDENKIPDENFKTEHLKNITKNMAHVSIDEGQIKPKEVDENKIPDENFKTDQNKVLKTDISPGSNLISAGNCAKEIGKSICKSDLIANDNDITEEINENSCLLLGYKDDSLAPDNRPNDFVTKDSISAENEPSFKNEKKKNSKNSSKTIQNNEVLLKVANPTSITVIPIPEHLKSLKFRDLIQLEDSDKNNVKKYYRNNSEQVQILNAEQRDCKFISNSSEQQEKLSGHFLTDAGASSCGTSYVKLVRRKKIPCDILNKTNFDNAAANPDLSEALDNTDVAIPSTSTSLKRKRVAEDDDYVPPSEKSKKKKLSNGGKDSVSSEKKTQEVLQNAQKKSHVKSKLNNTSKRTVGNNSGSNDSPRSHSGLGLIAGAAENSNVNSVNNVTILKDFAGVLSCHEAGCNCESADEDEIIDKSVDFVFAYFCKLSQEFQKFS